MIAIIEHFRQTQRIRCTNIFIHIQKGDHWFLNFLDEETSYFEDLQVISNASTSFHQRL
jgi:hypothetical protein